MYPRESVPTGKGEETTALNILKAKAKKVLDATGNPVQREVTERNEMIDLLYKKYANFNNVKKIIGTTVNPDSPPLGYLYAKLPFNGKYYEYL